MWRATVRSVGKPPTDHQELQLMPLPTRPPNSLWISHLQSIHDPQIHRIFYLGSPKDKTKEELNFTIKILFLDIFFVFLDGGPQRWSSLRATLRRWRAAWIVPLNLWWCLWTRHRLQRTLEQTLEDGMKYGEIEDKDVAQMIVQHIYTTLWRLFGILYMFFHLAVNWVSW